MLVMDEKAAKEDRRLNICSSAFPLLRTSTHTADDFSTGYGELIELSYSIREKKVGSERLSDGQQPCPGLLGSPICSQLSTLPILTILGSHGENARTQRSWIMALNSPSLKISRYLTELAVETFRLGSREINVLRSTYRTRAETKPTP
ncbi:hypothetical protein BDW60DRAFT_144022 [Aspergillus nidulans var. acristatus]